MAGHTKKRILIVDDNPIVLEGLSSIINQTHDLTVCGMAEDASSALGQAEKLMPEAAVVDLSLMRGSGLALIGDMLNVCDEMPILVLSIFDEKLYAERVLRAGAKGYIMKHQATDNILDGLRVVLDRKHFFSDEMMAHVFQQKAKGQSVGTTDADCLSNKEIAVLEMMGKGVSTKTISVELGNSIKTVESHQANIKTKLGINTNAELIAYAAHWRARAIPGQASRDGGT